MNFINRYNKQFFLLIAALVLSLGFSYLASSNSQALSMYSPEPPAGLMIQVSSLAPNITPAQLKTYLEDIRLKHRDAKKSQFINQIVLQDIADKNGTLFKNYLDVIAPYLPGGASPAFDKAYVGTVDIAWTGTGSKYIEGIADANFRAQNINSSKIAAQAFKNTYPKAVFDWYITYEANLAGFWSKPIETNYLTYFNTLIPELNKIYTRNNPLWSPAFWTTYANEPAWALPDLKTNLDHLFTNTSQKIIVDLQDFVGQSNGLSKKEDAVVWINYLKTNFGTKLGGVKVNVEQFRISNGALVPANYAEVADRMDYYKTKGVEVGPSWEIRFWHKRLYGF